MDDIRACEVLGLDKSALADNEALKRSYKAACVKWHPDKNLERSEVAERAFKEIQAAFRHLTRLTSGGEDEMIAMTEDVAAKAESFAAQLDDLPHTSSRAPYAGVPKMRIGQGVLFIGTASSGRPHGEGELVLKDGSVHVGSFTGTSAPQSHSPSPGSARTHTHRDQRTTAALLACAWQRGERPGAASSTRRPAPSSKARGHQTLVSGSSRSFVRRASGGWICTTRRCAWPPALLT
jgi:hypothetical protein